LDRHFLDEDGTPFAQPNEVIIEKFQNITEIAERRYARPDQTSKDLGAIAGQKALEDAGWDAEDLDLLIVGQNFGDIEHGSRVMEQMPSIASRVKHEMGIENPNVVAFDVLAGCPGWIQGVLVAEAYLRGGMAKKALVIGCETLSRIVDPHDRDSMIFSDGAGAACFELKDAEEGTSERISEVTVDVFAQASRFFRRDTRARSDAIQADILKEIANCDLEWLLHSRSD